MRTVRIIPAAPDNAITVRKNVAAYCRVSTQQEIQHHSLEAQRKYFSKLINQNPNWTFVEIYADQASGRNNVRMRAFQQMMADCRAGKIDLILVKSISRLGRNTVQFLEACNELNQLRVEVYFEVEKLYLSDPNAVKMLTIYASLYQQESESKSFAVKWGHQVRFADGSSKLYDRPCYGYRKGVEGTLEIVPEQAAVVKRIFALRLEGYSLRQIAKVLEADNIPAPRGGKIWGVETIRTILSNEKYFGAVMLRKTYVADYFKGRQAANNGEVVRYVFENHHKSIVK